MTTKIQSLQRIRVEVRFALQPYSNTSPEQEPIPVRKLPHWKELLFIIRTVGKLVFVAIYVENGNAWELACIGPLLAQSWTMSTWEKSTRAWLCKIIAHLKLHWLLLWESFSLRLTPLQKPWVYPCRLTRLLRGSAQELSFLYIDAGFSPLFFGSNAVRTPRLWFPNDWNFSAAFFRCLGKNLQAGRLRYFLRLTRRIRPAVHTFEIPQVFINYFIKFLNSRLFAVISDQKNDLNPSVICNSNYLSLRSRSAIILSNSLYCTGPKWQTGGLSHVARLKLREKKRQGFRFLHEKRGGTSRIRSDSPRNGKKTGPFALTNGPEKGEGRLDFSKRPS